MKTSDQVKPNPYTARKCKLRALTPAQKQSLIRWLKVDQLTYAAARERVSKEFGVSTSPRALCEFWQQHCSPASRPAPAVGTDADVLFDIVIQPAAPVRLIVQRKGGCVDFIFKSEVGNLPMGEPIGNLPTPAR